MTFVSFRLQLLSFAMCLIVITVCYWLNKKISRRKEPAMLRVIEYFAKTLKITQDHSK